MVVLISDLHLSDDPARSTINVRRLLDHLTLIISGARAKQVRELTLVLLGDIFEILKSEIWIERQIRPWEESTSAHVDAVAEIVKRIDAANGMFFDELAGLLQAHDGFLHLVYIPGNHDRALNTEMGIKGRKLLRIRLPALSAHDDKPSDSADDKFQRQLVDEEHELIAQHGHEFDQANRYEDGYAAVGDAVVIEFVLRLPMRVRRGLQLDEDDDSLRFLDEMDNVRPHSLKTLTDWIDTCLAGKDKIRSRTFREIERALGETLDELLSLKKSVAFGSFAGVERQIEMLLWALRRVHKHAGLRPIARLLPEGESSPPYPTFALDTLQLSQTLGGTYRYFVCGHTHDPIVVPVDLGPRFDDRVRLYLNTGTWRRVHRVAGSMMRSGRVKAFSCVEEGCVVSIYSREDQRLGFPPYEFHRLKTGPHT